VARLRRTAQAVLDADDIWLSIAADTETAAAKVIAKIYEAEARLAEFPELGRIRPDLAITCRSWAVGAYVIYYRVDGNDLLVLRILHGARDTDDLLAEP